MADFRQQLGDATVKGPSTASAATDFPLIVAHHPSSPTPTGANLIGKVGIDQTTPGTTNAVSVSSQPEVVGSGTISTTDIVVAAPAGTGAFVTGTPTAGSYVVINAAGGNASVVIEVLGLTTGTLWYEGSADSTTGIDGNWVSLNLKQAGIVNTQITQSITVNGLFRGNTAGIKYIRIRSVGTLTGTPTIILRLSAGVAGEFLFGSIPTGANTIGSVKLTDGTNTGAIKAASTAAAATDTALVVSLSPNSPITLPTPLAFTLSSAATTNATLVKATAATLYNLSVSNVGAAAAFLKLFNLTTAPTVGTSVPALTVPIPASGMVNVPISDLGQRFTNGLSFSITNLVADTDATAIVAAQVKVLISYL